MFKINTIDIFIYILKGSGITLKLSLITIIFSIPLGVLIALGKVSTLKILNYILSAYTWCFRGTPLLLQIFFVYFGLPVFGIRFKPLTAASIAFVLNYSAYLAEIFRSGINSINIGQFEAAKVLGMNYYQTMSLIILPQAVTRVFPPVCSEAINLIKDTALVSVIGIGELSRAAKEIVTRDFTITPFAVAAVIYLTITMFIVLIFRQLEKKYVIRS